MASGKHGPFTSPALWLLPHSLLLGSIIFRFASPLPCISNLNLVSEETSWMFRSQLLASNCDDQQQEEWSRMMPCFVTNIVAAWSKLWKWNWTVTSHMSLCLISVYHHHHHHLKKRFQCLGHSFWHQIVSSTSTSTRRKRNDPECHYSFATHIAAIWSKLWWWNWMVTSHIHMSLCLTSVHHHHHHDASVCFPFLFRSHLLEDLGSNCEQQDEESRIMPSCITNIAAVWSKLWWSHWTITSYKSSDLTIASGVSHRDHAWLSRLDISNVTMWCFRLPSLFISVEGSANCWGRRGLT